MLVSRQQVETARQEEERRLGLGVGGGLGVLQWRLSHAHVSLERGSVQVTSSRKAWAYTSRAKTNPGFQSQHTVQENQINILSSCSAAYGRFNPAFSNHSNLYSAPQECSFYLVSGRARQVGFPQGSDWFVYWFVYVCVCVHSCVRLPCCCAVLSGKKNRIYLSLTGRGGCSGNSM